MGCWISLFWRRSLSEDLALRVADMYASGNSFAKISESLGISKSKVGGFLSEGITALQNNHGNPPVLDEGERRNASENIEPPFFPNDDRKDYDFSGMLEETILIQATPILRKVVLNSKVFLQHEYFQKALGYQGDVGDLLVEALDYYWKEMGFTIKISHDSVM